ncbi:hypothetical protein BC952_1782 [Flavobacterium limicola]|uniref:Uncharacterized protein n=1 Tax=Flavobacterium limicola TaxID=180441 RepID=A0A495S3N2_9FLAO|nr:hypothetical protein BC952_1782 [Flavobacterium limicola]
MFLNYIKNFFVKKTLKNSLQNLKTNVSADTIQTVGLLVDASDFTATELLIAALIAHGILPENIKTMVYCDVVKKNQVIKYTTFSAGELKWSGQIASVEINDFINEKFDLLISYYNLEKAILLQITNNSKAKFKVGFSSIDKRLNHFIIKTEINNYSVFISELFKYLKLLNKI